MRILLTNDDGYDAPGIKALCTALSQVGQVFMVAPDREKSATGHCITVHCPIRVEEIPSALGATSIWAVDGTPSDCVKLGIQSLLDQPPDIVVSGINRGPNLGTDVLYSGTVSAAMEGAIEGIPSFAFSLATHESATFTQAADIASKIVAKVSKKLSAGTLLNINIPYPLAVDPVKFAWTKLGIRKYTNTFEKRQDPRGRAYYWLGGEVVDHNSDDALTDIAGINRGEVTITPLQYDLTDYKFLSNLDLDFAKLLEDA